jgi:hypothetical protein
LASTWGRRLTPRRWRSWSGLCCRGRRSRTKRPDSPARRPGLSPPGAPRQHPAPPPLTRYECRHLERIPLGTPYPAVAEHVAQLLREPVLAAAKTKLVVDATGVGRPVVDMLERHGLKPIAVTITGGDSVTADASGIRAPKRDIIGAVQVLLHTERLKIAQVMPEVPALVQEFLTFRVKIDPVTAHDSYGSWREGSHDDLLLALAIAAWFGEWWREPSPPRQFVLAELGRRLETGVVAVTSPRLLDGLRALAESLPSWDCCAGAPGGAARAARC